ncbi:MAG: amidohydrolase family protein [Acidobacteria bacterium]|nr:amidohydrolase family protein [Acidobacteriota bacterium]
MTFRSGHLHHVALIVVAFAIHAEQAPAVRAGQAPAVRKVALVGGMLLDGYEAPPLHHAAILIEGDRIVRVGPAASTPVPPDYTVIDTSGRAMMPGMIELHAHLILLGHGNYGTWFPWLAKQGPATLPTVMDVAARQLLEAGITSAVDLGAPLEESLAVRTRINSGATPGPRMSMSGPWITRNGGGMTDQFGGITITSPAQATAAVDKLAAAGVDVIKAHSGLTRDDYQAIADAAHRHNLRVHAHVYAEQDVRNALETGIDVLTHAGSAGTAPPYSPQMITDIVNAGRPVVITGAHRAWVYPDTAAFPERLQDPELKKTIPPAIYAEIQDSLKNWRALGYFGRTDREVGFRERGMKQFIESNTVLGMGTDSGTPMNFHTEALWREAKAHVDMGMPPIKVISALTRIGASILGKQRDLGTIEPGKYADIIVVNGNPLYDITALSHVETVLKGGVVYKGAAPATARRSDARQ